MLNNVCIMGRITHTPELRYTQSKIPVCSFSIACERNRRKDEEKQTDFFDVVAWRNSADFVSRYFGKGDAIIVTGALQTRNYTDRDGNNRKVVEILANEINFAGGKNARTETAQESGNAGYTNFEDINDGDLPF